MQRVCFVARVKKEHLDEYKRRHREVWPEMLQALRDAGWRNYSLFLRETGELIGYVEVDDFEAAQAAMARQEVNARWQLEMKEFFELPPGQRPDEVFETIEEIFHLE